MSRFDQYFHPLRVTGVRTETPEAISFDVSVPADLADRFRYVSGQFCTVSATVEGKQVSRAYSMSSSPEWDEPLSFTVKRVPGGSMSNWLNAELAVGDVLNISTPTGRFVADEGDGPLLCFCAGSGITPVYAMIKSVLVATDRHVKLLYANRDEASVIFARQLGALTRQWPDRLEILHHLDEVAGFVTADLCAAFAGPHAAGHAYICGPNPFMDIAEAGLRQAGFGDERIAVERFDGSVPDGSEAVESRTEEIVVRLGGRTHTLPYRAGETLLATARRGGLNPPFSCQAGNCATCIASLREGEVKMKINDVLEDEEIAEGWVLTCQALPITAEIFVDYDA